MKKIFNHIILFTKTFIHIVIHGYKNTTRHKNMTYMTRKWSLVIFVLVINVKFWHSVNFNYNMLDPSEF